MTAPTVHTASARLRIFANQSEYVFRQSLETRVSKRARMQLMKRLNEEQRKTFIIVTHDPNVAEAANRVIHLKDGIVAGIRKGGQPL